MITYGNGQVLFSGDSQGFEIAYKGTIRIIDSPDNIFISANRHKIIGFMLDGTDIPEQLFTYSGDLKVLSCSTAQQGVLERQKISVQGVDYWDIDSEKWEDDGSVWGSRDGTYLKGGKQRFNQHTIAVNNNIKTQADGEYRYKDDSPVPANELIHIHSDGRTMTGAKHNKDSVEIYPAKRMSNRQMDRLVMQTRQATSTAPTGSSGSSSGGGGGY